MILQNAVKDCSKKSTVFEGRASRYEYLPVFLSCCIVIVVMAIMYTIVSSLDSGRYSLILYIVIPFLLVAYGICTVGLQASSFHDIGFTGWTVFLFFIAFFFADSLIGEGMVHDDQFDVIIGVYALVALVLWRIILLALPGAKGATQYGDDPLAHASQDGAQYYDGRRNNDRPNTSPTTIDQLGRLDSLRTRAGAMTKSRLVAIFVLFAVLFVVYLLASNQERISAEAKHDERAKEETKAIGLPKVTDDFGRTYYIMEGMIQNISMS
jgi:uncharacterized membrane protein YhaH (DUF805 family)